MNSLTYNYDLISHLSKRNFILRYKGSSLGVLWSLGQPLAQLLVFVFLFQKVIPLGIEAYPAFLFTGLLPWAWFSTSLSASGSLFMGNRDLVRKPNFSPWVLAFVNTLTNLFPYLIFLPVLFVLLVLYNRALTPFAALLPLLILIQGILIIGLSLIVATLNVFYRDVQHIVNIAVFLLFYLTPVFYRSMAISDKYPYLFKLNPMALLIQDYRAVLFYGRAPDWGSVLFAGIVSLAVFGIGYLIYRRQLPHIFDEI